MSEHPPQPTVGDDPQPTLAEVVTDAVISVDGVVATHSGMFGEVGTYLPGRRIPGIRLGDDAVEVHVTVSYGSDLARTAAAIRSRVSALTGARTVDVRIEDIVTPVPEPPAQA